MRDERVGVRTVLVDAHPTLLPSLVRSHVVDLHCLRARVAEGELKLSRDEAEEVIAELACARVVLDLPLDGRSLWSFQPHHEMVAQLLMNVAAGIATDSDARLVAGVIVQELTGVVRQQVRLEKRA